jgi:hypothetical protein
VEIELTAGLTGQQGMLTPPWHLIPPLVFPGVRVSLIFNVDYSINLTRRTEFDNGLFRLPYLDLHEKAKDSSYLDSSTPEYRLVYMIMDVAHHRLFGPPRIIDECELKKHRKFLHLKFNNKGIDAVNVNNTINHKKVQSCISPYFKMKSTPCISHRYTSTIASKLFNYKETLQCLEIEQLRQNSPKCSCTSPF